MKALLCLLGLHRRREAFDLQLGDEYLHRGWVCVRDGCSSRVLTPGAKVAQYDHAHPEVARAVQSGIKAMRRESKT